MYKLLTALLCLIPITLPAQPIIIQTAYESPSDTTLTDCLLISDRECVVDASGNRATSTTDPKYVPVDTGLIAGVIRNWTLTPINSQPPTDTIVLASIPGLFHAPRSSSPASNDVYKLSMTNAVPVIRLEASWSISVGTMTNTPPTPPIAHYNLGYLRENGRSGWWSNRVWSYANTEGTSGRGRLSASYGLGSMPKFIRGPSGDAHTLTRGGNYRVRMVITYNQSMLEVCDLSTDTVIYTLSMPITWSSSTTFEFLAGHSRDDVNVDCPNCPERPSFGWGYSDLMILGYVAP